MAKRKKKTKAQIELEKARRALKERIRYWKKKGVEYTGPLPKTAKGMRNLTGEKIKKAVERQKKQEEKERRRREKATADWIKAVNESTGPEPDDVFQFVEPGEPDDLGPSEEDYADQPVNDLAEAKQFLRDIEEYIDEAYPDVTPNNRVNDYVDEVKRQLRNIIDSARTKYGEDGLARWIWESGAGEQLYDLIGEAIQHYKMPLIYLVQIATILNGGPLSQSQSEQLTDFGTIEFDGDSG